MKPMRIVKVFIASSEELQPERERFDTLFNHLNNIFERRGIMLLPVKWEFLDASMGEEHKQEEYNRAIPPHHIGCGGHRLLPAESGAVLKVKQKRGCTKSPKTTTVSFRNEAHRLSMHIFTVVDKLLNKIEHTNHTPSKTSL